MMETKLPQRVGLQQRVVPAYRAAFFDSLARALPGTLSVFAGMPAAGEGIPQAKELRIARWVRGRNVPLGGGRFSVLWQRGWRKWIAAEDPEILILEANPRYLTNERLRVWMRRRGRPVIGWTLGPARGGPVFSGRLRDYYRKFSALVVYSGSGAKAFEDLGVSAGKIFIAPNAVESTMADALLARTRAKEEARTALGLDARPAVLFVGRLQKRKRVDFLLRACARLKNACQLMIVGDGPDRERLERIAADLFPGARFTGDLRGEPLGLCFLAADFFLLPGTGGLALQEAMVYAKAVAAAEADGSQRDLIREGRNGWLLPPGDEEALVRILEGALSDPGRLERMGAESRRIVRETATMEKMIDGFLQAIRFAMQAPERKP
jgi:glycosyltransferase involved in cell wall biosynthesis